MDHLAEVVRVLDERPGMTPPIQELALTSIGKLRRIEDILWDLADVSVPDGSLLPVCLSSPHEGEYAPAELVRGFVDPESVRVMVDVLDRGAAVLRRHSGTFPSVGFPFSRYLLDPNRLPGVPAKVGDVVPQKFLHDVAWDTPLYKSGFFVPVKYLVCTWWAGYWRFVVVMTRAMLERVPASCPVLSVDVHTFAPTPEGFLNWAACYGPDEAAKWLNYPMFILGTRDDETCDPRVSALLMEELGTSFRERVFEQQDDLARSIQERTAGRRLFGMNDPFKGVGNVLILRAIDPARVQAIQLEVNEVLYFDSKTRQYNHAALELIHDVLGDALQRTGERLLSGRY